MFLFSSISQRRKMLVEYGGREQGYTVKMKCPSQGETNKRNSDSAGGFFTTWRIYCVGRTWRVAPQYIAIPRSRHTLARRPLVYFFFSFLFYFYFLLIFCFSRSILQDRANEKKSNAGEKKKKRDKRGGRRTLA